MESARPTVADLQGDNHYAQIARDNWLAATKPVTRANQSLLKDDLWDPLEKEDFPTSTLLLLEQLQILEKFLWPSFNEDSSNIHILLLALIIATKRRENLPTWTLLSDRPAEFSGFFRRIQSMLLDSNLKPRIRIQLLVTVITAFQSLDNSLIRKECAPLVSISIWHNIHSEEARNGLLSKYPHFKKAWRTASKRFDAADDASKARLRFERGWLYSLILDFLDVLYSPSRQSADMRIYCERFLEFLCDLQSQFPTRRYVNTLLKDLNVLVAVKLSNLYLDEENGLIRDLFLLLRHYTYFPLDDHTGSQFSEEELADEHGNRRNQLQRVALQNFKEKLNLLSLANYASLDQRSELMSHLSGLEDMEMVQLADLLGFRTAYPDSISLKMSNQFLLEVLLFAFEKRPSFREVVKNMEVLPNEQTLYEASFQRSESYDGSRPLAVPKLNLQYLTTNDFLWRSFILFRCETFYGIKDDLEETVKRLQPKSDHSTGTTRFGGSSRMALAISKLAIIEVMQPLVGEEVPSEVKAEVILDVSRVNENVRKDWESLRPDDVVFLIDVQPQERSKRLTNGDSSQSMPAQVPYKYLRAAEVLQVLDDNGRALRAQNQPNGYGPRPRRRRLLLKLDAVAYQNDVSAGKSNIYESMNVVVRRRSRENNFKPILESIRALTLSDVPMPSWLQDVFLGLGDPAGASYQNLLNALKSIDFRDTFLDWQHLVQSYPESVVRSEIEDGSTLDPPYVLEHLKAEEEASQPGSTKRRRQEGATASNVNGSQTHKETAKGKTKSEKEPVTAGSRKRRRDETDDGPSVDTVQVSTYKPPNMGPYPVDAPKPNTVRFTPAQIRAIESGTQVGLTVVVGPPGTGKTDVATQIINNIYHDFPSERILLVAHSNQALNQLFQKIAALDIDQRHLLRLGHGEGELQLDSDTSYSKYGRVESFIENGSYLLSEVNRLAQSLRIPGAHGNTCETAEYFNTVHIIPAWTKFWTYANLDTTTSSDIISAFPFTTFFSNAPQPLFPTDANKPQLLDIASGCNHHITHLFSQLASIRPFEVLRHTRDKANYLLTSSARIIAMTATHAAIHARSIAHLSFHYTNLIMEEAAQITEIETFIPLALQQSTNSLTRVVLCGDHLQNAPIIQHQPLRQFASLDQSLFTRLIRIGVPCIHLDAQGRARPSLASLYSPRYTPLSLSNLPHTTSHPSYLAANAGLRYTYQFINVPPFKNRSESHPPNQPHMLQNLGEAEYAVALYQYLRLLGHPGHSIALLTTYAGQVTLLREILAHRCLKHPLFGAPKAIATVDRFQGEQADIVILSLVRSKAVGHVRDPRRWTVALSRARLGLYVLGRRDVFEGCLEMAGAMGSLLRRGDKLRLVAGEMFPTKRPADGEEQVEGEAVIEGVEHLGQYVFEMTKAKVEALKAEGPGAGTRGVQAVEGGEGDWEEEGVDVHAGAEVEGEEEESDVDDEDEGEEVGDGENAADQ